MSLHINVLELLTVWKVTEHFAPLLQNQHVLIRTDNKATAAYINRQGGVRSAQLLKTAPSQTAAALGAHKLSLQQSSVFSRCIEQRSGHYVERRPSTGRLEPPSRPGHTDLEQVRQSRGGSVCRTQKRAVRSLVLTEHTRQSSAGSGRVCTSSMAQDAHLRIPSCSVNPLVPGPSAEKAAVSNSDSSGAHGRVMVSMPAAADIRPPVGTPVPRGRSLSG